MNAVDLVGQPPFNNLTVISLNKERSGRGGGQWWNCRCLLCGRMTVAKTSELQTGRKKACGCLRGKTSLVEEVYPVRRGPRTWLAQGTYRENSETFQTFADVKKNGVPVKENGQVSRYVIPHPERLPKDKHKQVPPPYGGKLVGAALVSDLQSLKRKLDAGNGAEKTIYVDDRGQRWISDAQAGDEHGTPREFCRVWNKRKSRLRPNESALPKMANPNPSLPNTKTLYL